MSVDRNATVTTGRVRTRWLCVSCSERVYTGEPKAQDTWPARLTLTASQLDLLEVAAAEFRNLSSQCDDCNHDPHGGFCMGEEVACPCDLFIPKAPSDAVHFLEWIRPDALSQTHGSPVSLRNGTERR